MPHNGCVTSATLRNWIETLDEAERQALLDANPLVRHGGSVRDLDDLARRLEHPALVITALRESPLPLLQVVETTAALGLGATVDRLCALLEDQQGDPARHRDHVAEWLDRAGTRALVWKDGDRLRMNPGIGEVISSPLGLGRAAESALARLTLDSIQTIARGLGLPTGGRKDEVIERVRTALVDPTAIRQRVAAAPDDVLASLNDTVTQRLSSARRHSLGSPQDDVDDEDDSHYYAELTRTYQETRAMYAWLSSAGLALPSPHWGYFATADIPTEVQLALAPPDFRVPFAPQVPHVSTRPVPGDQLGRSAAAAASEFLATAMTVLEGLVRRPLTMVKAGGIGARELARHGKAVGAEPSDVRLSLTLAAGAGLLDMTPADEVTVADGFDPWRRRSPAERGADLSTAWMAMFVPPTLDRDEDGKTVPLLGPDSRHSTMPLGLMLCSLAAELPGQGVVDPAELMSVLGWQHPLSETPPGATERSWAEAHQLGLLADGAITPLGQAVVNDDRDRVVAALETMLPEVSGHALIGSDQTILVPGSPDPAVVDVLDVVAVREARGAANTWRITPESVRGALDAGYAVEDLIQSLVTISRKELPQALHYLMRDVARKHGHLTAYSAACAITSEEPALLAEVVATRGLRKLGLQLVAPTVALSTQPVATVLSSLRSAGYLPVAADHSPATVALRIAAR